jgi:hypothetical protein
MPLLTSGNRVLAIFLARETMEAYRPNKQQFHFQLEVLVRVEQSCQ